MNKIFFSPTPLAAGLVCLATTLSGPVFAAPASTAPRQVLRHSPSAAAWRPSQAASYKKHSNARILRSLSRVNKNVRRLRKSQHQHVMQNVGMAIKMLRQSLERASANGHVSRAEHQQLMLLDQAIARDMTRTFGRMDPWTFLR